MPEEYFEEGIVLNNSRGRVTIQLKETSGCQECSARIFCRRGEEGRTIIVDDKAGFLPGDKILLRTSGSTVAASAVLLYGIPLILLLVGIIAGMHLFISSKELLSSISSFSLIGLYYLILNKISARLRPPFNIKPVN